MKNLKLSRYGGLSSVKQKHYITDYDNMSYHDAPEKYGFYSFLFPYIDWFLLGGTDKLKNSKSKNIEDYKSKREQLNSTYKKFSVDGYIWTHIDCKDKVVEIRGSWYKVHSKDFIKYFNKYYALTTKDYNTFISEFNSINSTNKNPFTFYSTEHLEIFVPNYTKICNF